MTREVMQQALEAWQTSAYGTVQHHKAMMVAMTEVGKAILAQPALPPCHSDDAAAFIEKHLALRNYPANSRNAARAGWDAACDLLTKIAHPVQPGPFSPEDMAHRPGGLSLTDWEAVAADQALTIAMMKIEQESVAEVIHSPEHGRKYVQYTKPIDLLDVGTKLYASPPQRQPLTHEQRLDLLIEFAPSKSSWNAESILIDMVEAKLKEKNA
jgi:hypothetical protein